MKNVTLHLKELEKEEQMNPKVSRRKKIKKKIRLEWNEIKNRKTIQKKIMQQRANPLAGLTKEKR